MPSSNPYFHFENKAKEAMTFYGEVFGGEPSFVLVGGTPLAEYYPGMEKSIMHTELHANGLVLMASDMPSKDPLVKGSNVTVSLGCDSATQIKSFFEKLSEGGKVITALQESFWGDTFALVEDKFGNRWMLTFREVQA